MAVSGQVILDKLTYDGALRLLQVLVEREAKLRTDLLSRNVEPGPREQVTLVVPSDSFSFAWIELRELLNREQDNGKA